VGAGLNAGKKLNTLCPKGPPPCAPGFALRGAGVPRKFIRYEKKIERGGVPPLVVAA
jgi:hypothetical protein